MRSRAFVASAAVTLAILASMAPARAADLHYVTGPGGPFIGYTVPVIVVSQGDTLTYTNLDVFEHDVVSREIRGTCAAPQQNPCQQFHPPVATWCAEVGFTEPNTCPVFWTPLIGIGGQVPVYGLEDVAAGAQYEFYCSIHGNMDGLLVVLP